MREAHLSARLPIAAVTHACKRRAHGHKKHVAEGVLRMHQALSLDPDPPLPCRPLRLLQAQHPKMAWAVEHRRAAASRSRLCHPLHRPLPCPMEAPLLCSSLHPGSLHRPPLHHRPQPRHRVRHPGQRVRPLKLQAVSLAWGLTRTKAMKMTSGGLQQLPPSPALTVSCLRIDLLQSSSTLRIGCIPQYLPPDVA